MEPQVWPLANQLHNPTPPQGPMRAALLANASNLLYPACVSEDTHQTDLGAFIRQQRVRADLSLRRLADKAGISNPYLSQIERGIRRPSAQILKQLSRGLQISAETLYTRAGLIEEGADPPTVVEAVEADETLSPRHKQVLLDLYRTLIESTPNETE
jgi:transcriptional regulator with XRE-family HTH domain